MRLFLVIALAASTAQAAEQLTLTAPGLGVVGLSSARAEFFTETLAGHLTRAGVKVTTARDMQQLLGQERQRQLLGCDAATSCMAEVAAAMGSDGVVTGDVAKVGTTFAINLKVISGRDGKTLSTYQARAPDEGGVLDELERGAAVIASETATELSRVLLPKKGAAPVSPVRSLGLVFGAVGLAGAVAGAVMLGVSQGEYAAIPEPGGSPISLEAATAHAKTGAALQTGGWVAVIAGAAALGTGVALFVAGGSQPAVTASGWVAPGGGGLVVQGSF